MSVTSDTDPVLYEVRDTGVAVLTLNRPERMNGWGGGLATAFYERLDGAEADPAVRAIVVTGSGRAFCAGADMGSLNTISTATVDGAGGTDVGKLVGARHPHFVMTMRKPVVAAINGACAGMGLTMALVCDVRFAASVHAGKSSRGPRPPRRSAGAWSRSSGSTVRTRSASTMETRSATATRRCWRCWGS